MSSIGQAKLNGLNIRNDNDFKLNGINWQNQSVQDNRNSSSNNYRMYENTPIYNNTNYGDIPAADEIFNFSDTNQNTQNTKVKTQKSEDDRYMNVGIGMAIGAVAGGIAGSFIAPGVGTAAGLSAGAKIGALIGVAVGGFIGNAISK